MHGLSRPEPYVPVPDDPSDFLHSPSTWANPGQASAHFFAPAYISMLPAVFPPELTVGSPPAFGACCDGAASSLYLATMPLRTPLFSYM